MNKKILIGVVIVVVLLFGALVFLTMQRQNPAGEADQTAENATPIETMQPAVSLTIAGFEPATLTINTGDTVVWTNNSGVPASVDSAPHPMHNAYPPLNLGLFHPDETLQFTFSEEGTYEYHNHLNPNNLGTVIVQ